MEYPDGMTAGRERAAAAEMAGLRADPARRGEYVAARNEFVVEWLPLVLWVIRSRRPSELRRDRLDDSKQAGAVGLIEAADRFDPARGLRFTTFAERWVWGFVSRSIARDTLVYAPPQDRRLSPTFTAERKAARAFGRGAGGDEWAILRVADGRSAAAREADEAAEAVAAGVAALPPDERRVVALRYGLGGERELSRAEASAAMGCGVGAYRTLLLRAKDRIRAGGLT